MYKKTLCDTVQNTITKAYCSIDDEAYQAWLAEGNTPETAETPGETATRVQQETNAAAEEYLRSTDKWVIRFLETGKAVPSGITAQRAAKRLEVQQ